MEEIAEEYDGNAKIGKVNVDENQVAMKYSIRSIPALLTKLLEPFLSNKSKSSWTRR